MLIQVTIQEKSDSVFNLFMLKMEQLKRRGNENPYFLKNYILENLIKQVSFI